MRLSSFATVSHVPLRTLLPLHGDARDEAIPDASSASCYSDALRVRPDLCLANQGLVWSWFLQSFAMAPPG